jgi:GNAT superfamily N-acetyltransferase
MLPVPSRDRDIVLLAAFDDDLLVAAGRLDTHAGNAHLGFGEFVVDVAHRRRGIGSACLAFMEEREQDKGRNTLVLDVHVPLAGSTSAGEAFLAGAGYVVANVEITKTVDLAATEHLWPALAARAAAKLGGYALVWFVDPVPEQYADDVCAMYHAFFGAIPTGDVDLRPQHWDVARLRAGEERRRLMGVEHLMVAAQAPTGELVGYSDVSLHTVAPRIADINSTLVLDGHRGHRLGLAMKVLLQQKIREVFPSVELVVTGNADVNSYMNSVNDELGYRAVDRLLEMQKTL